jgi:exopolysaccharide biosynthesis protein
MPYMVERINESGPLVGVLVKVDLANPRVKVSLADDRDPDGDEPCVGLLDTTQQVARRNDFDITMNASFFEVPKVLEVRGKAVRYAVGSCGYPVGWHFSGGRLLGKPAKDNLRATLIVYSGNKVSIRENVKELPTDTHFAVSGNSMILYDGKIVRELEDGFAPTSAAGISADGKTLYLAVVDGRQAGHSRGATLIEMSALMLKWGAYHAINFDGGGSTTMVLKDPATGVFTTVNRPSDVSSLPITQLLERPVIDVIGISIAKE